MSRLFVTLGACALLMLPAGAGYAAELSGNYLEARTCDIYTGPCFANAEVNLAGREALMAWQVEEGSWRGVDLSGLTIAAALRASDTLGMGGGLVVHPFPVKAVVIVDERADAAQRDALVDFAKSQAGPLLGDIVSIEAAPITMEADFLTGRAKLDAGELAGLETRGMQEADCVCTNEVVFYPPLNDVDNAAPVFTETHRFGAEGLGGTWVDRGSRSAFLATFAY